MKTNRNWLAFVCFLAAYLAAAPVAAQQEAMTDTSRKQQLARLIHKYRTANGEQARLELSYESLQIYGHVKRKTRLPKGFRPALSDMKRQVLFTAMNQNSFKQQAIAVGIGSTGMWIRKIEANNYDPNQPNTIVENKLKGMYMGGTQRSGLPHHGLSCNCL